MTRYFHQGRECAPVGALRRLALRIRDVPTRGWRGADLRNFPLQEKICLAEPPDEKVLRGDVVERF